MALSRPQRNFAGLTRIIPLLQQEICTLQDVGPKICVRWTESIVTTIWSGQWVPYRAAPERNMALFCNTSNQDMYCNSGNSFKCSKFGQYLVFQAFVSDYCNINTMIYVYSIHCYVTPFHIVSNNLNLPSLHYNRLRFDSR